MGVTWAARVFLGKLAGSQAVGFIAWQQQVLKQQQVLLQRCNARQQQRPT
jgi:hypothetical protein